MDEERKKAKKELERLFSRLDDLDREIGKAYDLLPREAGTTKHLLVSAGSRVNMACTDLWMAVQSMEVE